MVIRRLFRKGSIARVRRSGVEWELDLREGIDFSIWLLGSFEPDTVRCYKQIVKSGEVVLDIGANIGAHTLILAQAVGENGKVYAFEPTDYAFAKLSRNRGLNPELATRIYTMQYMLVDHDAVDTPTPKLYSSWPLESGAGLHELHQGRLMTTDDAKAITLDSIVFSMLNLERVDLIKLDIDGFECVMLRGAGAVLSKWKPVIVMELAPYALEEQGGSIRKLLDILKSYDYELFDLSSGFPIAMDPDALQERIPSGASLNVIARVSSGMA